MKRAVLTRLETGDEGTFGRIEFGVHDGLTVLFTGEQPDLNNTPNKSCIPEGTYICKWTYSPAFKRMMYLVTAVWNRSGIRIHPANFMGDREKGYKSHLYGCIALGKRIGSIEGQKAILISRPAVNLFQDFMAGDDFELEIINEYS